ncbi:unnamed protein product, partial [Nezara viridula]
MSAMSASSGLMPLSLISEHKAAQGGPPPVQPLARTPEKHSLVQAPKPTPNGMEPSPPLIPSLPPSQPEPQPSLPYGGKSETICEEDRSGGSVPEILVPAAEPAPPSIGTVPEQLSAVEAAELPIVPEIPVALNQAPSSPTPAPTLPSQAPVPTLPSNVTVQPTEATEARIEVEQESLPQPEAVPSPEPAQVPIPDVSPKTEGAAEENQESKPPQEPQPSSTTASASLDPADVPATSPTPAPTTRQPKRTKQNANVGNSDKKVPAAIEEEETSGDDKKSTKRKRLPTQPYQSPIPELNLIAKISKIDKTTVPGDDKLIVFYRNEFLAVRNAEGGFYVCQALQNVYKTSSKIRIRWLSQVANTDHYSPDFYDNTEFDCILTNLNLERIDKNKFHLPDVEAQRTQSILKRAIDVEKGIAPPEETSITEEHPDGLDLSLYRNEDQLKKRKRSNKNKGTKKKEKKGNSDSALKRSRTSSRKVVKADSDSKKTSAVTVQQRRLGRPAKVEKPVVQRIVAAKKVGRRKLAGAASASVKPVKKETKPAVSVKRKSESQPVPVPEKKLKAASKTRSE